MPSSERRSADNITKMRKMSRMPATIEKLPKVVKIEMNTSPCRSAARTTSSVAAAHGPQIAAGESAGARRTIRIAGFRGAGDRFLPMEPAGPTRSFRSP